MSSGPKLPPPSKDLDTPDDVAELVRRFYADVAQDDLLGRMFNDVARVDWAEHLPKLTAFWCRILFGMEGYAGNPLRAHVDVHAQEPFTDAHFTRWLSLFHEHVESGWHGPYADHITAVARNVARAHSNMIIGEPVFFMEPESSPR